MKKELIAYWHENYNAIEDVILMLCTVLFGTYLKYKRLQNHGAKFTIHWFLAEGVMSFVVAVSVYSVFDQYFHFHKLFVYVVCAWCGSLSTIFQQKIQELIEAGFDGIKSIIKRKSETL